MTSRISRYGRILFETTAYSIAPPRINDHDLRLALKPEIEFTNLAEHIRSGSEVRFFMNPAVATGVVQGLRCDFPISLSALIQRADTVCEHIFDILGSGPTKLGNPINWHADFISGYQWPRRYFRWLKPAKYPGGYDIKTPWDLSECHHFVWLGQAYWVTQDEKYAQEYVRQTRDWLKANPPYFGVNWVSPMEVALRVANWLTALNMFRKSPSLSDEFVLDLLRSFLLHGRYLMANLEGSRTKLNTGNHYVADLTGLVYLGISCPFFVEAQSWLDFAADELWSELAKQTFEDGMHHEASLSYHRLVCEMFLYSAILCADNGIPVPEFVNARIQKMLEVIHYVTKPNGEAPLIGDSDNGRLHRLATWTDPQQEWLDYRYLLAVGGTHFGRDDLTVAAGPNWEEAYWLLGDKAQRAHAQQSARNNPSVSSTALPQAGIYLMRSDAIHVVVNAGRAKGIGKLGHNHNDRLSIELSAHGQNFIVDPGTYVYTRDYTARGQFRSTWCHNSVVVDEQEMAQIDDRRCFQMSDMISTNVAIWESNGDSDFLSASHNGYQQLSNPVLYKRELYLDKSMNFLMMRDVFSGEGVHDFRLHLQFRPLLLVSPVQSLSGAYVVGDTTEARLLIAPLNLKTGEESCEFGIRDGQVSLSYGHRIAAPMLYYTWRDAAPSEFRLIFVALGPNESMEQRWLEIGESWHNRASPMSQN